MEKIEMELLYVRCIRRTLQNIFMYQKILLLFIFLSQNVYMILIISLIYYNMLLNENELKKHLKNI